ERRLETWIAASALQRFHQRALFPTDVGTSATMDDHLQRIATAQNILANISGSVCLLNRPLNLSGGQRKLAPHVDKRNGDATGIAGNNHPFDQLMRIFLHQHPVLKRPRLALIRVTAEVTRLS